jgi:hypothetical protein
LKKQWREEQKERQWWDCGNAWFDCEEGILISVLLYFKYLIKEIAYHSCYFSIPLSKSFMESWMKKNREKIKSLQNTILLQLISKCICRLPSVLLLLVLLLLVDWRVRWQNTRKPTIFAFIPLEYIRASSIVFLRPNTSYLSYHNLEW